MKAVTRKIIAALLAFTMIMSFAACDAGVITSDNISISDLSKFRIVYSADYEDWQMEEITLLQNVIKHLTGKNINAVPDTEEKKGNEIVLASSSRENHASEAVKNLAGNMDYVISAKNGEIVLGGKSYYADMKAVYDFVNNYLGYDDLEDKYIVEEKTDEQNNEEDTKNALAEITGTKTEVYKDPKFTIMVSNPGEYPFACANDVKVMADAGFNMVNLETTKFTSDFLRKYIKWCARFNIRVVQQAVYNVKTKEFISNDVEFTSACPIVYGHYVEIVGADGLGGSDIGTVYKEQYSKYGWKLVTHLGTDNYINRLAEKEEGTNVEEIPLQKIFDNKEAYKDVNVISVECSTEAGDFDRYASGSCIATYEKFREIPVRNGLDYWIEIDCGKSVKKKPRAFVWQAYLAYSYGITGVEYPEYKKSNIMNSNNTKSQYYENIKETNETLLKIADMLENYNWVGIKTIVNYDESDIPLCYNLENQCKKFDEIFDIEIDKILNPFLVGCFEAKDGSGKQAYVFVNINSVADKATAVLPIPFKIKQGNVVKSYKDFTEAELTKLTQGSYEGYYTISISNGQGLVITVE